MVVAGFGGLGVVAQGGVDAFFGGVEEVGGQWSVIGGQCLLDAGELLLGAGAEGLVELFRREEVAFGGTEFLPLFFGVVDGGADFSLDLEEGAGLAGELHFVEDGFDEFAEQGRVEGLDEVFEHGVAAGHGLGTDDV